MTFNFFLDMYNKNKNKLKKISLIIFVVLSVHCSKIDGIDRKVDGCMDCVYVRRGLYLRPYKEIYIYSCDDFNCLFC